MNTHNGIQKLQNSLVKIVKVDSIPLEHCLLRRVDWDNDSKLQLTEGLVVYFFDHFYEKSLKQTQTTTQYRTQFFENKTVLKVKTTQIRTNKLCFLANMELAYWYSYVTKI